MIKKKPYWRAYLCHRYVHLLCRLTIGAVFVYASLDKIADPAGFAKAIYYYRFLPSFAINFFALVLPGVEFVCGVLLILGLYIRECALILLLLFLSFTIGLGQAVVRGLDINCGCFSSSADAKVGLPLLLRDLSLALLPLQLFICEEKFLTLGTILKKLPPRS